jgi:N-acetylglucosaminyl-diphospho-decaprenol L-rhamnosyltransferase
VANRVDLSIIVLNFRTPAETVAAIESARKIADKIRAEFIVVDNASGDDSVDYIRRHIPDTRIVEMHTNRGFAAGMNAGIRQSTGDFVFLMNSDVEAEPGSIETLFNYMRSNPDVGLAAPLLLGKSGEPSRTLLLQPTVFRALIPCVGKMQYWRWQRMLDKSPLEVEATEGAALLVRRETIEQVGLLDEDFFFYHEIVEWCMRIRDHGFRVIVLPESRMIHTGGGSTGALVKAARIELKRSEYKLLQKRLGRIASKATICRDVVSELISICFYAILCLLSFGKYNRAREKFAVHWAIWTWIMIGMPERNEASYRTKFGRWD